jgi:uncharacterized membrane protein
MITGMKDKWLLGLAGGYVVALLLNLVQLKNLTGLPAHPLLLHMPVIFVPCLVLAAIVFVFKPSWRKTYGIAYGIGAIVTLAGTTLAAGAGEQWEHVKEQMGSPDMAAIHHHGELGDTLRNALVLLALGIIVQVAIDRGAFTFLGDRFENPTAVLPVLLSAGILGLALISGYLVYATGHAGAKIAWGEQQRGSDLMQRGKFPPPSGGTGQGQPPGQFKGQYYSK